MHFIDYLDLISRSCLQIVSDGAQLCFKRSLNAFKTHRRIVVVCKLHQIVTANNAKAKCLNQQWHLFVGSYFDQFK